MSILKLTFSTCNFDDMDTQTAKIPTMHKLFQEAWWGGKKYIEKQWTHLNKIFTKSIYCLVYNEPAY